jgi:hypothetical protein
MTPMLPLLTRQHFVCLHFLGSSGHTSIMLLISLVLCSSLLLIPTGNGQQQAFSTDFYLVMVDKIFNTTIASFTWTTMTRLECGARCISATGCNAYNFVPAPDGSSWSCELVNLTVATRTTTATGATSWLAKSTRSEMAYLFTVLSD